MALIEDILALNKVLDEANIPTDKRHIYISQEAYVGILRLHGYTEEEIQKMLEVDI